MANIAARRAGKWRIIETAIWDKQHLDLCGPAFIEFDIQGQGEMAFGALEASLACGSTASGIDFEWNGADEGDQGFGDGWADLRQDGRLEREIAYHNGDEITFLAAPWTSFSAACYRKLRFYYIFSLVAAPADWVTVMLHCRPVGPSNINAHLTHMTKMAIIN